jgi:hypothetical protein
MAIGKAGPGRHFYVGSEHSRNLDHDHSRVVLVGIILGHYSAVFAVHLAGLRRENV